MSEELNMPLDFYVGLLCEMRNAYGVPGIYELPFAFNYHRVPTTQTDWIQSEDEVTMLNASDITFPTAMWDWGMITHFGLWLSWNKQDCIMLGDLLDVKTVIKMDVVNFAPLSMIIEIAALKSEYEKCIFGGEQNHG